MTNAASSVHPSAPAAAADEWFALVDQALLGLDHALNNRLGALRAFAELLRDEQWRSTPAATDSVQKEVARLEETTSIVRLLARPRQAAASGLIVEEVMSDAVRIQAMLHDVRDVPIEFVPGPPLEPAWADRPTLIRLLSLVLYALRRNPGAGESDRALRVATDSDDDWVRIRFKLSGGAQASAVAGYAASLAESIGVAWRETNGVLELRLPTLKAHRATRGAGEAR